MRNPRIDISYGLDGEAIVVACFDLGADEIAAAAHAVSAMAAERFRTVSMSADDVLEFRELTALVDELAGGSAEPGIRTLALRPARLTALRDSVARFVESRDEADWMREEDHEPLARLRALIVPLEDLSGEALRAALSPAPRPC